MAEKMICPHCGSEQFMAFIKRGCIVESNGVDKDGKPTFKVVKEGSKDNYEIELFKCVSCSNPLNPDDLISGTKCKKCGKPVNPADLNEDGVCSVCAMLDDDPSLGSASTETLLRLLAEARKGANPVKRKIAAKEEKAAKVEEKAAATAQTTNINDILEEPDQVQPEEKPKKTRAKAQKKKAADKEENVADKGNVQPEQGQKPEQELADGQDAPFPDLSGSMNAPEPEQAPAPQEAGNNEGFQMFDETEEQPF